MHDLDHLQPYIHDWVDYLTKPDDTAADYTGPRCPFAKKVRDEDRYKINLNRMPTLEGTTGLPYKINLRRMPTLEGTTVT